MAIHCSAVAIEAERARDFSSCVIFCLGMALWLNRKVSLRSPIADIEVSWPTAAHHRGYRMFTE